MILGTSTVNFMHAWKTDGAMPSYPTTSARSSWLGATLWQLAPRLLPLPDLPTNLRSLNLATWFWKPAVAFRRSAEQFSSFPAVSITFVPSETSLSERTLNGTGRVLLHRQCEGRIVHTKFGLFVRTNSPGYSAKTSEKVRSPRKRLA